MRENIFQCLAFLQSLLFTTFAYQEVNNQSTRCDDENKQAFLPEQQFLLDQYHTGVNKLIFFPVEVIWNA